LAKIVFLGNFRVDYTSESHHAATLESLGHKVTRLQETEAKSEQILKAAVDCDLFIWIHTHGWKTPGKYDMGQVLRTLADYKIPTMTYHLDLWFGLQRQKDLGTQPVYKHIGHFFTVDRKMADWFNQKTKVKGHYLPAGVFDKECIYKTVDKTHDIVFVGSKIYHSEWKYRPKLIDWLGTTYAGKFEQYGSGGKPGVRGLKLNKLYWSTKIVVGDTLCIDFKYPDYWSDRVYETLGRGGFLIHPYVSGMEREFEDKKRKAGHELVKEKYTYKNRWEYILKELGI